MALITTPGFEASLQAETSAQIARKQEVGSLDLNMESSEPLCAGDWTVRAMCRGKTALFFAPPGERDGRRRRREALANAYCAVCPVREICEAAGRQGREHGIWGGENDEERATAGFAPRSPHRRAVARAAREARERLRSEASDIEDRVSEDRVSEDRASA